MGSNLQAVYKVKICLDKMSYAPGELINGSFSFDFGNDQEKKKKI